MPEITLIRHAWPEMAGFLLKRENGLETAVFLHFFNSVELLTGGRTVQTRPHACIFYAPGQPQRFLSNTPLTHDWMHIEGDLSALMTENGLKFSTVYYPSGPGFVTDMVREMEREFFSDRRGRKEMLGLMLGEFFIRFSRAVSGDELPAVDSATAERLRHLRGRMLSDLSRPWSVGEMAKAAGLSQSRFFAVYRSVYGRSPADDMICARIDAAKNALEFGTESIAEIAESLGYNNISHFTRQFHAVSGMTPLKYRKEKR